MLGCSAACRLPGANACAHVPLTALTVYRAFISPLAGSRDYKHHRLSLVSKVSGTSRPCLTQTMDVAWRTKQQPCALPEAPVLSILEGMCRTQPWKCHRLPLVGQVLLSVEAAAHHVEGDVGLACAPPVAPPSLCVAVIRPGCRASVCSVVQPPHHPPLAEPRTEGAKQGCQQLACGYKRANVMLPVQNM